MLSPWHLVHQSELSFEEFTSRDLELLNVAGTVVEMIQTCPVYDLPSSRGLPEVTALSDCEFTPFLRAVI